MKKTLINQIQTEMSRVLNNASTGMRVGKLVQGCLLTEGVFFPCSIFLSMPDFDSTKRAI
jgi:hypothetical protein